MPLRCINTAGEPIHSFAMDTDQWAGLKAENKADKHLRMPCCGRGVVLKTSPLGTRFFAHSRRGECESKPESAEHLMLKSQVAMAIAAAGWEVATEVRGHSSEGDLWIADVMATRGSQRFAVEIQLSKQSHEVTVDRHFRYRASGVRCLWLFRQRPIQRSGVPAIQIAQGADGGFDVLIGNRDLVNPLADTSDAMAPVYPAKVPIDTFISRVFSGSNLWFGVFRKGHRARIKLSGRTGVCSGCLGEITVVSSLWVIDPITGSCLVVEPNQVGEFISLLEQIDPEIKQRYGIGRFRRTSHSSWGGGGVSNTCPHCSAGTGLMQRDWNSHSDGHQPLFHQEVVITPEVESYTRLRSEATWHIDLIDRLPGHRGAS